MYVSFIGLRLTKKNQPSSIAPFLGPKVDPPVIDLQARIPNYSLK